MWSIIKKFISIILTLVRKFPTLLLSNIFVFTLSALISSAGIFSLAPVVDSLLKTHTNSLSGITQYFITIFRYLGIPVTMTSFLIVFLVFLILKNGFLAFCEYMVVRTQFAVRRRLVDETYNLCFNARWQFFSSSNQGTLLNTFTTQMTNVGTMFGAMSYLCSELLRALFFLIIPFFTCWQATVVCIVFVILFSVPLQYLARLGYHLGKKSTISANFYMAVLQESIGAAKLILGFGNQDGHIEEVNERFYQFRTAAVHSRTLTAGIHALYEPLFAGVLLFVLYLTFYSYSVPLSETLVMYYAFHNLMPLLGQINTRYHTMIGHLPSYEQVVRFQDFAREQVQTTGSRPFIELKDAIVLQNVWFSYSNHSPVLQEINVSISKGKMTAFVGGSGVGKTTLLDLILGFYEHDQGIITIDGIPLQEYDIWSFRQRIGFVPQDTVLFNTSIRKNLLWGNDKATQYELDEVCKLTNAYDFIMALSDRYDTIVGDRGVRLSGGQRQRIALARAVLRKPELLLLDEATSSLDSQSERLIQEAIEKIARETTVVVVAHRLSTIMHADYIYVLDKGQVVGEGQFDDLVEKNRVFNRMVELQKL